MCTPGHTTICDWATSMNAVKKVLQHKDTKWKSVSKSGILI